MNKYISFVILVLAQVSTFVICYEVSWSIGLMLLPETRRDLFWGGTVRFAVLIFAVVSLIGSLLSQVLLRRHMLIVQGLSSAAFSLFFIGLIEYRPYRVLLLLACGVIGFLFPALLLRRVLKKNAASNNSSGRVKSGLDSLMTGNLVLPILTDGLILRIRWT